MVTIEPKDGIFNVKNCNGAIIATLTIYKGAFGKYLYFNQKIGDISVEELSNIVDFMNKYEKNHRD